MKIRTITFSVVLCLVVAACGGSDGSDEPGQSDGEGANLRVESGDAGAVLTIGGETWEFANVACVVRADSFEFIAADGIIGVTTDGTIQITVQGDPENTEAGTTEVAFFAGPLTNPEIAWRSTTESGGAVVRTDGSRVSMTGQFDDALTDSVETVDGEVEGDCGEMPEVPVATTTVLPGYEVDGTVTVGGDTFDFTYDPDVGGVCGRETNDGRLLARGWMVTDPSREVLFTYGLPEETPDGEADMQLIIYAEDGQQLWYSQVGFIAGADTGSIETLTRDGNTVTATGTLTLSGSSPEELAEFTFEATCGQ